MTDIIYIALIAIPVLIALVLVFGSPKRKITKVSRIIYLTAIFVFTYLPIFVLIVFSFNSGRYRRMGRFFSAMV